MMSLQQTPKYKTREEKMKAWKEMQIKLKKGLLPKRKSRQEIIEKHWNEFLCK